MKVQISKKTIINLINDAESGALGREVAIGGENYRIDITLLRDDIPDRPDLAGGTLRVFLNRKQKYIGHTLFTPKRK